MRLRPHSLPQPEELEADDLALISSPEKSEESSSSSSAGSESASVHSNGIELGSQDTPSESTPLPSAIQELCTLFQEYTPCDIQVVAKKVDELKVGDLCREDEEGFTFIDYAASHKHFDFLTWVTECKKIDRNTKCKLLSLALCTCAKLGLVDSCQVLLKLKADVNFEKPEDGAYKRCTPLEFAVDQGHEEVVGLLLKQPGINLNHIHIIYPSSDEKPGHL